MVGPVPPASRMPSRRLAVRHHSGRPRRPLVLGVATLAVLLAGALLALGAPRPRCK